MIRQILQRRIMKFSISSSTFQVGKGKCCFKQGVFSCSIVIKIWKQTLLLGTSIETWLKEGIYMCLVQKMSYLHSKKQVYAMIREETAILSITHLRKAQIWMGLGSFRKQLQTQTYWHAQPLLKLPARVQIRHYSDGVTVPPHISMRLQVLCYTGPQTIQGQGFPNASSCVNISLTDQRMIPQCNSPVCLYLTAPFVHKTLQPNQQKLQVNIYEYIIQHNEAQINEKLDQIE